MLTCCVAREKDCERAPAKRDRRCPFVWSDEQYEISIPECQGRWCGRRCWLTLETHGFCNNFFPTASESIACTSFWEIERSCKTLGESKKLSSWKWCYHECAQPCAYRGIRFGSVPRFGAMLITWKEIGASPSSPTLFPWTKTKAGTDISCSTSNFETERYEKNELTTGPMSMHIGNMQMSLL